jgi:diguanylate cyclase (GGDEF)-like protein
MNYFYISTLRDVEVLYAQYTKDRIIDIKKSFLKDSINNIMSGIEQTQTETKILCTNCLERASKVLTEYYKSNQNNFVEKAIDYFELDGTKEVFTVFILDQGTNKVLYENKSTYVDKTMNYDEYIKDLKEGAFIFKENIFGDYYLFYGVMEDYIQYITEEDLRKRIYGEDFSNDAYIWVNEILDYNGGDNYAIRLIHPNLEDTEGMYLSTKMQDIKGNYPYLAELNGINENGEIYFNYFFKKKSSEEISEKLTYAKLYEKYNWVIAMGIYFDDIEPYINEISKDGDKAISKMILLVSIVSFTLIIVGVLIILFLEHWYYSSSNRELKEELNIDVLTKAFNRRAAIEKLEEAFNLFKKHDESYAIIMFDIDDFKKVNDNYGHDVGDLVLKNMVEMINKCIRDTDFICRWGGEEFLLICEGLKVENMHSFVNKILKNVEKFEHEVQGDKYHITISIGASCFNKEDKNFEAAIKRADMALYESKKKGKNRATVNL